MPTQWSQDREFSIERLPGDPVPELGTYDWGGILYQTAYASVAGSPGRWKVVFFQHPNNTLGVIRWLAHTSVWTYKLVKSSNPNEEVPKILRHTPLTAYRVNEEDNIRLHFLDTEFQIWQWNWKVSTDTSNFSKFKTIKTAPWSKLSSISFGKSSDLKIWVYYQATDNTIKESDAINPGADKDVAADALPGTGLAFVNTQRYDENDVRPPHKYGYYQTKQGGITEVATSTATWPPGVSLLASAAFLTPIAATSSPEITTGAEHLDINKINLYWLSAQDTILEKEWDSESRWGATREVDGVTVVRGGLSASSFTRGPDNDANIRIYASNALSILTERLQRWGVWENANNQISLGSLIDPANDNIRIQIQTVPDPSHGRSG